MQLTSGVWAFLRGPRARQLRRTLRNVFQSPRAKVASGVLAALLCVSVAGVVRSHGTDPLHRHLNAAATHPSSTAVAPAFTATPAPQPTETLLPLTMTSTATGTALPAATSTWTASPEPTATPSSSETPSATASGTPTMSPSITSTPTITPTPTIDKAYRADDTLDDTGPGPAGPLSGLPTRPELSHRRAIAVVIDNYAPDARPQTGLNRASLVFETLAEGGVTRIMAVFLEKDAPVVGPVRSARIYFDAWASGLHAIYAHAGGNSDALYQLLNMPNVANIDDLNLPSAPGPLGPPFMRSPYRAVPHNLYTSTLSLRGFAAQAGFPVADTFPTALPHRVPDAYFHRPETAWIDVGFSGYWYDVHWAYDRVTNRYLRSIGGVTQVDSISGLADAASNVVVLFTPVTPDHDAFTPDGVNVHATGTGSALYFQDGHVAQGSWSKPSTNAALELRDSRGKRQQFNPGQTWIEVVDEGSSVTYGAT